MVFDNLNFFKHTAGSGCHAVAERVRAAG